MSSSLPSDRVRLHAHALSAVLADGRVLYRDADLVLADGLCALVGRNGVGKSTLLRQLAGVVPAGQGRVLSGRTHLLRQSGAATATGRVAEVLGIAPVLDALSRLAAGAGDADDLVLVDERWDLPERVRGQLAAAGLDRLGLDDQVRHLSGGERQQLLLLAALHSQAEVLLLDEPTNHLDAAAAQRWFDALSTYPGAVLAATHDRDWLRRMPRLHELGAEGVSSVDGGLEAWLALRAQQRQAGLDALAQARLERERARRAAARARETLDRREARDRRMRRDANQAAILLDAAREGAQRSQGRRRHALAERLSGHEQAVRTAHAEADTGAPPDFVQTAVALSPGARVLTLDAVHPIAAAPATTATAVFRGPVRIGLTGANGSGKSTLLRILAGAAAPAHGAARTHPACLLLDQHLGHLPADVAALDWLQAQAPSVDAAALSTRLALIGLAGAQARLPLGRLSGGERMRVALAAAAWTTPAAPVLLLDEPTNHLDLDSIEAVTALLQAWPGALVVASHDAALLDALRPTARIRLEGARCDLERA